MKTNLRKTVQVLMGAVVATILITVGCHKDSATPPTTTTPITPSNTDNYSSMAAFFAKNGVATQVYSINGATGGTLVTIYE